MNGCVDATRIRPGPDGDLTCPGRTSDEEKRAMAAAAHCKKLGMIAIPSDPDKSVCRATTEVEFDLRFDPCNNPQAMPTPDQCPAVPAGGGTPGPTEPTPPGPDPRLPQ